MSELQVIELPLTKNALLNFNSLNLVMHQLLNRRLVVLPTETGYMLAANALDEDAVRKIYKVKERQLSNPIHVAVSGMDMAEELVYLNAQSRRLCNRFFPGPLTVICPKREIISDLLVANTGNLGIRVPDSPVTLQVVQAFGKPITATSLNLSGESFKESLEDTIASLNWEGEFIVYVVKDNSQKKYNRPSTLVSFGTNPWSILREGPIEENEIRNAINTFGYSDVQDWT